MIALHRCGLLALCIFAVLAAGFGGTSSASAQNPIVLERLKSWDASAPQPDGGEILAQIQRAAQALFDTRKGMCKPKSFEIASVSPITSSRLIFNGILHGQLRNGWIVSALHKGCPESEAYRYMLVEDKDSILSAVFVNLGKSNANPTLMNDTSWQAALVAQGEVTKLAPKCGGKDISMVRTRIDTERKGLGPDVFGVRYVGSWSEVWTFSTCDRTVEVGVDFAADGDGGAYTNIKSSAVRVLNAEH